MTLNFIDRFFLKKQNRIAFYTGLGLVIFAFARNNGMFWDNILFSSIMGNHLYYHGIFNWNFPIAIDTGHPPFLAFLLASAWKVLGHKLWVSHLVILPFIIGFFYQLHLFVNYYLKNNFLAFFAFLLVVVDPTLSVQFFVVNPEIIFLFFFLLAVNAILYDKYYLKILALAFLSIISLRSMMLAAGIFIFESISILAIEKKGLKALLKPKFFLSYLLGSLPGVIYILWRLFTKGYIQTHPESPWSGFWHFASPEIFLKNFVIFGHRFLDFGRVFIFIFLIFSFIRFKKKLFTKEVKQLLLLAISSIIVVSVTNLLSTNTMGHRYFISANIVIVFLSYIILIRFYKKRRIIYSFLFIALLTGNLWIYPRNIAQGWDASLAHIPYHSLRLKAINYMDKNNIEIAETGSFSINTFPMDAIDFTGDSRAFQRYNGKNNYLFYSNIFNLKDDEYSNLDNNYVIIKEFKKFRIHIYIYKLKKNDTIRR